MENARKIKTLTTSVLVKKSPRPILSNRRQRPQYATQGGNCHKNHTKVSQNGKWVYNLRQLRRILETTDRARDAWLDDVGSLWLRAAAGGGAQTDHADAIEAARLRACYYKRDNRWARCRGHQRTRSTHLAKPGGAWREASGWNRRKCANIQLKVWDTSSRAEFQTKSSHSVRCHSPSKNTVNLSQAWFGF